MGPLDKSLPGSERRDWRYGRRQVINGTRLWGDLGLAGDAILRQGTIAEPVVESVDGTADGHIHDPVANRGNLSRKLVPQNDRERSTLARWRRPSR